MMNNGSNERLKIYTQHVPLRQKAEEEVRGKDLEAVWDDANEWTEEAVRRAKNKTKNLATFFFLFYFSQKISVFLSMVFEALKAKADGVSYGVASVLLTCSLRVSLSCWHAFICFSFSLFMCASISLGPRHAGCCRYLRDPRLGESEEEVKSRPQQAGGPGPHFQPGTFSAFQLLRVLCAVFIAFSCGVD